MVQVPTAIVVTMLLETVQTPGVWLLKVTGNPDEAVTGGNVTEEPT